VDGIGPYEVHHINENNIGDINDVDTIGTNG
jgi:hypothetical protein